MKETEGLDCCSSGGAGLDGGDLNRGGAESVVRGSESGRPVGEDSSCVGKKSVGRNSGSRGPIMGGFETFCGSVWKERIWLLYQSINVPVNQRIVAVEPIVSKNERNGRVQLSNIKCYPNDIASGMADG